MAASSGGARRTEGGPPRGAPIVAGPARALAATYAVFALAAGARSGVQLATNASCAPVAYTLSALAAVIYLVGTVALRRTSSGARRVAVTVCGLELIGVLAVGAWSQADPGAFADQTVWSGFGAGYGHVPLVLPILGLLWLTRAPRAGASTEGSAAT
jgi:hypothetical protein